MTDDSDPQELSEDAKKRLARRSGIPPKNGGYVPIEELEALADEWDKQLQALDKIDRDSEYAGLASAHSQLQDVIAEYRGASDE